MISPLNDKFDSGSDALQAAHGSMEQDNQQHAQKPCVMVVHASVGSGHRSAANSIAEAFSEDSARAYAQELGFTGEYEVCVLDILDYGRIKFDGDKAASMFIGATRPIYDLTWRFTFTGRLLWGGGTSFSSIMFPKFTQLVAEKQPLAIICTHITAANCAVGARMVTQQSYPVICVPTDYETEGFWPHREADAFCVATDAMAETLRPRLVPDRKIYLTGIPTRKGFRESYDCEQAREQFGLPSDKRVILALAGARMPTPYLRFREALDHIVPILSSFPNLHLVLITGNDQDYLAHVKDLKKSYAISNMTILSYVEDMGALMSTADAAICKPGGLTVTECLCSELPMILIGQAYGQEKANVLMLTSLGAALHVTTARELMGALRRLDQHPESYKSLLVNAAVIKSPAAAPEICKISFDLAREYATSQMKRKKRFLNIYWGKKPAHTR